MLDELLRSIFGLKTFLRQRYKRYKARDGKTDEIDRLVIEVKTLCSKRRQIRYATKAKLLAFLSQRYKQEQESKA